MLKFARVMVVLITIASPLMAQTEQMSAEQVQAYKLGRLYVDGSAVAVTMGFWALDPNHSWTARRGLESLSESMFYETAGYPNEAKRAAAHKSIGWACLVGGGAMFVGGLAWMTLGVTSDYSDPNYLDKFSTSLYGGMAVSLLGIIPFYIGMNKVRKNITSTEQAQMIADEYNTKLARKITGE
jgi:hypothetical protein